MRSTIALGLAVALGGSVACSRTPRTAQDVIERSVRAHGGDRLSNWKTITIDGTVEMQDGIAYMAAYRVQAKSPGKLRVEHDLTADRGRRFDEYFLNDGTAWSRTSLIVRRADAARLRRWLDQCYGPAHYVGHPGEMTLQPDAVVEWKVPEEPGSRVLKVMGSRPAWVVRVTEGEEQTDLYFDKESFHLLQEIHYLKGAPQVRRVYWNFKDFGGVTFATKVNEFNISVRGDKVVETLALPITQTSVKYDEAIEDWVFEEDKPRSAPGQD
ncbi:MAG: hypothetical protein ACE148_12555 [Vicinamibacterales bacterium]